MVDKFVIGRTLQSVVNMERTGGDQLRAVVVPFATPIEI